MSAPKLDQHWGTAKAKAMAADGVALGACEGDAPAEGGHDLLFFERLAPFVWKNGEVVLWLGEVFAKAVAHEAQVLGEEVVRAKGVGHRRAGASVGPHAADRHDVVLGGGEIPACLWSLVLATA